MAVDLEMTLYEVKILNLKTPSYNSCFWFLAVIAAFHTPVSIQGFKECFAGVELWPRVAKRCWPFWEVLYCFVCI